MKRMTREQQEAVWSYAGLIVALSLIGYGLIMHTQGRW